MEILQIDIRKLLRYEFLRGTSASEAMESISEAEGAKIVVRVIRQVKRGVFFKDVQVWKALDPVTPLFC